MIYLDITGFYYRYAVDPTGITTVFDLMNSAAGKTSGNGGVLTFEPQGNSSFCQTITVDYGPASKPESRQSGDARPKGRYSYTDDVTDKKNWIIVPGCVPGFHVWQYYITDADGKVTSGLNTNGERRILGFKESDKPPYGASLKDGFTVTWRLVAIFGLAEIIDNNREILLARSGGKPMGLKAVMAALR